MIMDRGASTASNLRAPSAYSVLGAPAPSVAHLTDADLPLSVSAGRDPAMSHVNDMVWGPVPPMAPGPCPPPPPPGYVPDGDVFSTRDADAGGIGAGHPHHHNNETHPHLSPRRGYDGAAAAAGGYDTTALLPMQQQPALATVGARVPTMSQGTEAPSAYPRGYASTAAPVQAPVSVSVPPPPPGVLGAPPSVAAVPPPPASHAAAAAAPEDIRSDKHRAMADRIAMIEGYMSSLLHEARSTSVVSEPPADGAAPEGHVDGRGSPGLWDPTLGPSGAGRAAGTPNHTANGNGYGTPHTTTTTAAANKGKGKGISAAPPPPGYEWMARSGGGDGSYVDVDAGSAPVPPPPPPPPPQYPTDHAAVFDHPSRGGSEATKGGRQARAPANHVSAGGGGAVDDVSAVGGVGRRGSRPGTPEGGCSAPASFHDDFRSQMLKEPREQFVATQAAAAAGHRVGYADTAAGPSRPISYMDPPPGGATASNPHSQALPTDHGSMSMHMSNPASGVGVGHEDTAAPRHDTHTGRAPNPSPLRLPNTARGGTDGAGPIPPALGGAVRMGTDATNQSLMHIVSSGDLQHLVPANTMDGMVPPQDPQYSYAAPAPAATAPSQLPAGGDHGEAEPVDALARMQSHFNTVPDPKQLRNTQQLAHQIVDGSPVRAAGASGGGRGTGSVPRGCYGVPHNRSVRWRVDLNAAAVPQGDVRHQQAPQPQPQQPAYPPADTAAPPADDTVRPGVSPTRSLALGTPMQHPAAPSQAPPVGAFAALTLAPPPQAAAAAAAGHHAPAGGSVGVLSQTVPQPQPPQHMPIGPLGVGSYGGAQPQPQLHPFPQGGPQHYPQQGLLPQQQVPGVVSSPMPYAETPGVGGVASPLPGLRAVVASLTARGALSPQAPHAAGAGGVGGAALAILHTPMGGGAAGDGLLPHATPGGGVAPASSAALSSVAALAANRLRQPSHNPAGMSDMTMLRSASPQTSLSPPYPDPEPQSRQDNYRAGPAYSEQRLL